MVPAKKISSALLLLLVFCVVKAQNNAPSYPIFRQQLDSIVAENYTKQSSYYHFARLYQRVSDGIATLATQGKIKDTAFITLLENTFGSYYLKNFSNDTILTYGWLKAFDTTLHTNNYATTLILSMNTHVNHDLFFALTEVFKQHTPTKANKSDFKMVAKVHDKIIADYFENILPHLKADKKWKRQAIRKLAKQAANGLKVERNRIWDEAKKAAKNDEKFAKYSQRRKKSTEKLTDSVLHPKGLLKKGMVVADALAGLPFEEKVFLINNQRP